jgi:hypothetical protein
MARLGAPESGPESAGLALTGAVCIWLRVTGAGQLSVLPAM